MTDDRIRAALQGVVAVLIAPYDDRGRLDESMLTRLVERLDESGIHAITALGNTAEVFQLTAAERTAHVRAVARATHDAVLVAGVVGGVDDVVEAIDEARDLGYDLAMVHEPSDPFGDSDGVHAYYAAIADRAALPLALYLRTERLSVRALREIVRHPAIAGVKYARPGLADLRAVLELGGDRDCAWVNGSAESRARQFLGLGLTGFTSGIANARPDLALAVHAALVARDPAALETALARVEPVEQLRTIAHGRHNVAVLKELLRLAGADTGRVRPPHAELPATQRAELHAIAATWPPPAGDGGGRPTRERRACDEHP